MKSAASSKASASTSAANSTVKSPKIAKAAQAASKSGKKATGSSPAQPDAKLGNGKTTNGKPAPTAKPAPAVKSSNGKADASKSAPSAKPTPSNSKPAPAAKPTPAAKTGAAASPVASKGGASATSAAAPSSAKAPATPAPTTKGSAAAAKSGSDTPIVPKKGPIDLAQHKSVAAAAAAVAQSRTADTGEFIIINGRRVRAISTKGLTIAKKSKSAAAEAPPPPTDQQIAEIKTKLSKKELDEYRTLLLAKRRQLVGMLSGMEDEALRSSGGNLSNMPVHMADMGSDVYEQDFTLGMAETERAILSEIDAALLRIENKTFGVCQMTGKPISKARLDAKPWAKYTIEAERIAESGGAR
jgi:RNA polymerase-binding transcription factor DksA